MCLGSTYHSHTHAAPHLPVAYGTALYDRHQPSTSFPHTLHGTTASLHPLARHVRCAVGVHEGRGRNTLCGRTELFVYTRFLTRLYRDNNKRFIMVSTRGGKRSTPKSKSPTPKKKTPVKKSKSPAPKKASAKKTVTKKSKSPAPKKKTPVKKSKSPAPKKASAKKAPAKKRAKTPPPAKKTPVKRKPSPPAKKASPPPRAKTPTPAKRTSAKPNASRSTSSEQSASPLPITAEQQFMYNNYYCLILGTCFMFPFLFAHVQPFIFSEDQVSKKMVDGVGNFGALLIALSYFNLYGGARAANLATANAGYALMYGVWAALNYNTQGKMATTCLFGFCAVLNIFGSYGQDTRPAGGSDSQKFVWFLASFLWTLDSIQNMINGSSKLTPGSSGLIVRMTAVCVMCACITALRSPPSDLGAGLAAQRQMFLIMIFNIAIVMKIFAVTDDGNLNFDIVAHVTAAAADMQVRLLAANFAVSWLLG